jgi:hypothetical protein
MICLICALADMRPLATEIATRNRAAGALIALLLVGCSTMPKTKDHALGTMSGQREVVANTVCVLGESQGSCLPRHGWRAVRSSRECCRRFDPPLRSQQQFSSLDRTIAPQQILTAWKGTNCSPDGRFFFHTPLAIRDTNGRAAASLGRVR